MPTIIKDNAIIESPFTVISIMETTDNPGAIDHANGLLPMTFYQQQVAAFAGRLDLGIWLSSGDDVEALGELVQHLPVIALHFPTFGDGRAYSSAAILRTRLHYQGEIRAIGDVRRDELEQMQRCGINAFELAEGQDAQACLQALTAFSFSYQASVDRPTPLFRHRVSPRGRKHG
jgi:uncharacterized protein (DUF934 family)